jgi:hypothetical protein
MSRRIGTLPQLVLAITDVDRRPAGQPGDGAMQRLDAPAGVVVDVDVECWFFELITSTPSAASARASAFRTSANAIAVVMRSP